MKRIICFYLLLAACLSMMACTSQFFRNYGRINPSNEATRVFESYSVNPDFRYYVSGAGYYPNALMGLHRDYRIDPKALWREVLMTPEMMKELVENMKTRASQVGLSQYGFEISDDKGRPIGVWYSPLEARTFIHMNEDGTITIDTPPLDTYEKREKDSSDRKERK